MANYAPPLLYEHAINVISGAGPKTKLGLRSIRKISANVTVPVHVGRVGNINSSGEIELGHSGNEVPMYLFHPSYGADVSNPSTTEAGNWSQESGIPAGKMTCVPAIAHLEIETTEFDTSKTYLPNQFVAAVNSNSLTTGGRISNAIGTGGSGALVPYTDAICGIVASPPERAIQNGVDRLRIWTYFLPAAP